MKLRNFDIGRQQESLLNEEHYNIFKILEPYLKSGSPNDPSSGPTSVVGTTNEIMDGAMWIDKSTDPTDSDLKYFSNGQWNLFFKNRFKITQDIISSSEPSEPIEGQLWIDEQGVLNYYYKGVWKPIKAVPDNLYENANLQGFEDFIITESLTATEQIVIDNFTSWLLSEVPVPKWEKGITYEPNQGCVKDLDIYVCRVEHDSDETNAPDSTYNSYYWTKVQKLYQYLVPNSREDKFYLDGYFVHEECPIQEADLVPTAIAGEFKAGEKTAAPPRGRRHRSDNGSDRQSCAEAGQPGVRAGESGPLRSWAADGADTSGGPGGIQAAEQRGFRPGAGTASTKTGNCGWGRTSAAAAQRPLSDFLRQTDQL